MSVLKNIHHPDLKAEQRLLKALDELGIARRDQLADCLGWTENSVQTYIHRIRRKGTDPEVVRRFKELKEKIISQWSRKTDAPASIREEYNQLYQELNTQRNEWVKIYHPPKDAKISCYMLGSQAMESIKAFSYRPVKAEEVSQIKWGHYLGVNDILVRLIRRISPEGRINLNEVMRRLKWGNEWSATDFLFRSMEVIYQEEWKRNPKKAREERREIIRPDAYIVLDGILYWIEFDNDTEAPRKIEKKLKEYILTLNRIDNRSPVVWVAKSKERSDELRDIWEYTQETFQSEEGEKRISFIPEMYFFDSGCETDFFVSI